MSTSYNHSDHSLHVSLIKDGRMFGSAVCHENMTVLIIITWRKAMLPVVHILLMLDVTEAMLPVVHILLMLDVTEAMLPVVHILLIVRMRKSQLVECDNCSTSQTNVMLQCQLCTRDLTFVCKTTELPTQLRALSQAYRHGILFILCGELLVRKALEGRGNFRISGCVIYAIKYADDLALLAKNKEELQEMIYGPMEKGRRSGMEINFENSKIRGISK
uniref:Reverse transcriptase domain-containing protein n=1 Tax=Timema cristinae TaxID=61476 RepID=A0A7R9H7T6_TIMCR|nr:unnamed protein product [Timema cristinae]